MDFFSDYNGFRIFTKVEGSGKPLLLLHSLWGSHRIFDSLAIKLSLQFKVIRIDFPGHGKSPSPINPYSFKEFAPVLDHTIRQIDIDEKISIVGHSMGGFSALAFSKEYPSKVNCLVLMNTFIKEASPKSIRLRERQIQLISEDKTSLLLGVTNPSNFAPGNSDLFRDQYELLKEISGGVSKEGAMAGIGAINSREDSTAFLQESKIPILYVVGKKDMAYDPDEQICEIANISFAEVLVLNHSGHLGFIEEEELLFTRLPGFLHRHNSNK